MGAFNQTTSGSLTATGSVTLTSKNPSETTVDVMISGTYGTVTFVFEGSIDGTNFVALAAVDRATGTPVSGTIAPSDNAIALWSVSAGGCVSVRARVTAIASGTATFNHQSANYSQQPIIPIANTGQTLGGTFTFVDGANLIFNTTTGSKIGTATSQKLAFFNATPIIQPANTVDYLAGLVNLGLRASGGTAAAAFPGVISSSSATGGIGYATGAGGAVTQITNRSTGVTLNKICGTITTDTTSLAAGAEAKFTVTNSTVAATDAVIVNCASGNSGIGTCMPVVTAVAAGSFDITITNQHASTAETGACVLNFAVLKGVAA